MFVNKYLQYLLKIAKEQVDQLHTVILQGRHSYKF